MAPKGEKKEVGSRKLCKRQKITSNKRKEREEEPWVKWISCPGRDILLRDLEPGGFLVEMDHLSAEDLWPFYKDHEEFKGVPFDQFRPRLNDHRMQSARDRALY